MRGIQQVGVWVCAHFIPSCGVCVCVCVCVGDEEWSCLVSYRSHWTLVMCVPDVLSICVCLNFQYIHTRVIEKRVY